MLILYKLFKRFADILVSAIALVLLIPVFIPVMLALKLSDNREIFFFQSRVGYHNELFRIYKFVTMVEDENSTSGGLRVTKLGKFLRKTKINELPQFINILRGDMSIVGPRPVPKITDFDYYPKQAQEVIYNATPGITGIGSVVFRDEEELMDLVATQGNDSMEFKRDVIFPYKSALEIWYINNQSFFVDLKIIFLTAWAIIFPSTQLPYSSFKGLPIRSDSLKREFNKMQQLKESVTLLLIVVGALIPLVPPPFWFLNNLQFISLSLFIIISFGYAIYREKRIEILLNRIDFGWLVFVLIGFLSYFWAIDGSLMWYQAFGWTMFVLLLLVFRAVSVKKSAKLVLPYLFCTFFLVLLAYHLVAISYGTSIDSNWNSIFGKNANHSSTFLLMFFPFLLFYPSHHLMVKMLKWVSFGVLLVIFYVTAARGALFSLFLVLLYYIWTSQNKRIVIFSVMSSLITVIGMASLYGTSLMDLSEIPLIEKYVDQVSSRLYMSRNSLRLFFESPMFGSGLGNWHIEAYKFGVHNVAPFNDPNEFIRFRSHNLFGRLLAELGLVGFISFVIPLITLLWRGIVKVRENSDFQKASFAALLVYMVTSYFYVTSNFHEYLFSGIQLLAFASIGILTNNTKGNFIAPKWASFLLLFVSTLCFIWFVYAKSGYDSYKIAQTQIVKGNTMHALSKLESIYNPVFRSSHDYMIPLPLELGKQYEIIGDTLKAEQFYSIGIKKAPFHESLILAYSTFLLEKKNDLNGAFKLAQRVYQINDKNNASKYLLAKISFQQENLESAKSWIDQISRPSRDVQNDVDKLMSEIDQFIVRPKEGK